MYCGTDTTNAPDSIAMCRAVASQPSESSAVGAARIGVSGGGLDRGDPNQLGSGSRIAGWAGRGFGRCAGGEADRGEHYECRETR